MNKQDALNKLAALEAETKALRAIIEAPEVPALPVRWRPARPDNYYQVAGSGHVTQYDDRLPINDKEYAHGNCFKTSEHAEIAAKAVSQTLKVCAAAFAVDPDAGTFVKQERHRTAVRVNNKWEELTMGMTASHAIYVHTIEQARQMAAILSAEGV